MNESLEGLAGGYPEWSEKINEAMKKQIEPLCCEIRARKRLNDRVTTESRNEPLGQFNTLPESLEGLARDHPKMSEKVNSAITQQIERL
jgi:hypothetical protein